MNALRTIASLAVTLITVGIVAMIALAVYPAVNGGLDVEGDITFSAPEMDEKMNIYVEAQEPLKIKSTMPYDITRLQFSAYMDMGNDVRIMLTETEELTVKTGESVSINLSFTLTPAKTMEIAAWSLAYNLGSASGLSAPAVVHFQGYYFDNMFGGSADVGMDFRLSPSAKVTLAVEEKSQIKGTISGIDGTLGFVPDSGTASICGADGVSVLDCSFVKSGSSIDIDSKTADGRGIVEAVKACAEANGGKLVLITDVSGYGPMSHYLDEDETDDMIDAITAAVDSTLGATA